MKRILIWIIILILAGIFVYFTKYKNKNINNIKTYTNIIINNYNQLTWIATSSNGYSFEYPEKLGTTYINTVDWPPVFNIENKSYTCIESGVSENDIQGKVNKEIINGKEFCITRKSEGAAGSVYTNYTYTFAIDNQTGIFTFTTRQPQCMNYDDPKQTECINEENNFEISNIIDIITSKIKKI